MYNSKYSGSEVERLLDLIPGKTTVVQLSQADYDALETKDSNTLYLIEGEVIINGGSGEEISLENYFTKEEINGLLSGKSNTGHTHSMSDIVDYEAPEQIDAYTKEESDNKYQPKGEYLTEHQSLEDYALKTEIPSTDGFITEATADNKYQPKGDYLTEHQSLEGYALKTEIPSTDGFITETQADGKYLALSMLSFDEESGTLTITTNQTTPGDNQW